MNLFNPNVAGKIRALSTIVAFIIISLTSPQVVDLGLPWLQPVVAGLVALQQAITHFTRIGNNNAAQK